MGEGGEFTRERRVAASSLPVSPGICIRSYFQLEFYHRGAGAPYVGDEGGPTVSAVTASSVTQEDACVPL